MTSRPFWRIVVPLAVLAFGAACEAEDAEALPPPGAPCLELAEGVRYEVTLQSIYDAASDFYYEPRLLARAGYGQDDPDTCDGRDGLALRSAFSFTTGRYSPADDVEGCSYREMTELEGVEVHPGRYFLPRSGIPDITAAGWTREPIVGRDRVNYRLMLLAPAGDLTAEPVVGERPPAVVVRAMADSEAALEALAGLPCTDAWVARVHEESP